MRTALIIGSGPAGLFCAYSLARNGYDGRILIAEKGKPFANRLIGAESSCFDPDQVAQGEGGAGFLADCKLCISENVGIRFEPELKESYAQAVDDVDSYIYQRLLDIGVDVKRSSSSDPARLAAVRAKLKELGLQLDTYPVRSLGSDIAGKFLGLFVNELRALGVELALETSAEDIVIDRDNYFHVQLRDRHSQKKIIATHLFLAVGWSGSSWLLHQVSKKLPLFFASSDFDIGVRIEFPPWGGEQLRELGGNPRIKLFDGISYAKTHCFVHHGRVFYYYIGNDACLVDAHAVQGDRTKASTVNILYRVPTRVLPEPVELLNGMCRASQGAKRRLPLAMRMTEFLRKKDLPEDGDVYAPTLPPTQVMNVDLGLVIPSRIMDGIRELIVRLAHYAPGIATRGTVVYAPAVQWAVKRIDLNDRFAVPNVRNLWCIGDCSGRTAGVLPAAVSGVVAAKNALASKQGDHHQALWSFP